jgi:hypothetical protein
MSSGGQQQEQQKQQGQQLPQPPKIDTTWGPSTAIALLMYGGVKPATHASLTRDIARASYIAGMVCGRNSLQRLGIDMGKVDCTMRAWPIELQYPHEDALVDRTRAMAVQRFLKSGCEVLVMVDHDIEWRPAVDDLYCGDLCHIARKAVEKRAIVGGMVCKKSRGEGVAVLWKPDGEGMTSNGQFDVGSEDRLVEVHAVGAAFTAYPREVLERVSETWDEVHPGFKPIWLPEVIDHPLNKNISLHMSEDWMLCWRASRIGYKSYISTLPVTLHHGSYAFSALHDANPVETPAEKADSTMHTVVKEIEKLQATGTADEEQRKATQKAIDDAGEAIRGMGDQMVKMGNLTAELQSIVDGAKTVIGQPAQQPVNMQQKETIAIDAKDMAPTTCFDSANCQVPVFDKALGGTPQPTQWPVGSSVHPIVRKKRPKISLLHATRGQPLLAQKAMLDWWGKASNTGNLEYILSTDDDDARCAVPIGVFEKIRPIMTNNKNRGVNDAYNRAAYASTGEILVQVHDDLIPPPGWDDILIKHLNTDKSQVLFVSDGLPAEVNKNPDLIAIAICTRKWAKKLGGLFYPGYISVFCDNDAGAKARREGAIVDVRDSVTFKHEWKGNRYPPDQWEQGKALFKERADLGFPDAPELWGKL